MSKPRRAINATVAANIKAIRRSKHITQEQLAASVGRSDYCIRLYEKAQVGISPKMLNAIAAALGVSVAQLETPAAQSETQ